MIQEIAIKEQIQNKVRLMFYFSSESSTKGLKASIHKQYRIPKEQG